MSIKDTVMRSLTAIGGAQESDFYARLFRAEAPERFALIVLDPRCLKNPLLEALISDLRILADLELTPVLLVGALNDDRTTVKFNAGRLSKEIESAGVKTAKLNTASYGLIDDVRRKAQAGRLVVLEMTDSAGPIMGLPKLVSELSPAKVIFLQPSGGLRRGGKRLAVINLGEVESGLIADDLTAGQERFLSIAGELARNIDNRSTYVMASPLNLLQELFTTKGSGTLMRRAAHVKSAENYQAFNQGKLRRSIEEAFQKPLDRDFFARPILSAFIEEHYRGGAILTTLAGLPYLSKFWVVQAAQGDGIARDIWDAMRAEQPAFFWRSRMNNPFNEWYMKTCDGMQVSGDWRIFWTGLNAPELPAAIIAAASAPHDFDYNDEP